MFDIKRIRLTKAIVIVAVLFISLTFFGCTSSARGWPGAQIEGNKTFVGSIQGTVFALNTESGSRLWEWKPTAKQTTGGFLSCGTGGQFRGGMFYAPPVIVNGLVYVGSYDNKVYVFDADTGGKAINYEWDIGSPIAGGVAVGNGTLFVGSSKGKLSALNADSGAVKWEFVTGKEIWATPIVSDGIVYFGSLDHKLYAVDIETGNLTLTWDKPFQTGGGIASTALVVDGVVYVGSFDSKFYAVNAGNGTIKWVFDGAGNWFWSKAVYDNGIIYVGSLDQNVYAIDSGNGTLAWPKPFQASGSLKSTPVIVDGVLVVASEDGKVYGIDLKTGEEKWQSKDVEAKVFAPLVASNGKVYINAQNNRLYVIDGATGRLNWSVPLSE